jgi:hypothetical protein
LLETATLDDHRASFPFEEGGSAVTAISSPIGAMGRAVMKILNAINALGSV